MMCSVTNRQDQFPYLQSLEKTSKSYKEKEDDLEKKFELLNRELRAMMAIEALYRHSSNSKNFEFHNFELNSISVPELILFKLSVNLAKFVCFPFGYFGPPRCLLREEFHLDIPYPLRRNNYVDLKFSSSWRNSMRLHNFKTRTNTLTLECIRLKKWVLIDLMNY
ncbi:hypothetical protein KUTeg_013273 [Tegillarca granosa]|uniref:Uncharacterized protein n=1 Tax=Tegillarca granosa TaxID=220873 RepID=A0ABQ9ETK9_TEGGR|nr:hypothetical protein KUTeg_013273 [Tegillarca granosa]